MTFTINNSMESNIKKYISDIKGLTEIVLKKELRTLLTSISTDYNINKTELFKKYLSDSTAEIDDPSNIIVNSHKCIAVTKNYKQCSRNKYNDNKYCKNHLRQSSSDKGLPQGTVYEIIPAKPIEQIINYVSNVAENSTVLEKKQINGETYYIDQLNNTRYELTNENIVKKVDFIK